MSSVTYLQQYDSALKLVTSNPLQKLLRSPVRFAKSQLTEIILRQIKRQYRVVAKTFWQEQMEVWFPEPVSVTIQRYGVYEPELTSFLLRYLKPGYTFIDIGAHFGYFTLLASALVGKDGEVHSFEPTPSTFSVLAKNSSTKQNIKLNNLAVWSNPGTFEFSDYGLRYSAFNSFFNPRLNKEEQKNIPAELHTISSVSLDQYTVEFEVMPDFIKIDAESSEYQILLGMKQVLTNKRPIISLEVGDEEVEETLSSNEIVKFLLKYDYVPYELTAHKVIPHEILERYRPSNLLFIPKEKSAYLIEL